MTGEYESDFRTKICSFRSSVSSLSGCVEAEKD